MINLGTVWWRPKSQQFIYLRKQEKEAGSGLNEVIKCFDGFALIALSLNLTNFIEILLIHFYLFIYNKLGSFFLIFLIGMLGKFKLRAPPPFGWIHFATVSLRSHGNTSPALLDVLGQIC